MYVYKCVQVPEFIKIGNKDAHSIAVKEYEDLVNSYASDGWEYVNVDTIESFFEQGCFKRIMASIPILGAFFRSDELIRLKMIVFRKPSKKNEAQEIGSSKADSKTTSPARETSRKISVEKSSGSSKSEEQHKQTKPPVAKVNPNESNRVTKSTEIPKVVPGSSHPYSLKHGNTVIKHNNKTYKVGDREFSSIEEARAFIDRS